MRNRESAGGALAVLLIIVGLVGSFFAGSFLNPGGKEDEKISTVFVTQPTISRARRHQPAFEHRDELLEAIEERDEALSEVEKLKLERVELVEKCSCLEEQLLVAVHDLCSQEDHPLQLDPAAQLALRKVLDGGGREARWARLMAQAEAGQLEGGAAPAPICAASQIEEVTSLADSASEGGFSGFRTLLRVCLDESWPVTGDRHRDYGASLRFKDDYPDLYRLAIIMGERK